MKRIIYKVTFLKGSHKGHYYVGQHSTENINDGYVGSGKYPKRYFKKYGTIPGETYVKEILEYVNSQDELDEAEKRYVNLLDPLCMNITPGGRTNRCTNKGQHLTSEWKSKISQSVKEKWTTEEYRQKQVGQKRSEETCRKISLALKGKHLSEESRKKYLKNLKVEPGYTFLEKIFRNLSVRII